METTRRCLGGRGLMFAGLIVMLVGLAVVVMRTVEIPRYWTPVVVGAVLFLIGAARHAIRDRSDSPPRA
jgi:xanthine/uracil permease